MKRQAPAVNISNNLPGSHIAKSVSILDPVIGGLAKEDGVRALEIGVGAGDMLSWLESKGLDPVGLDTSQPIVDYHREKGFDVQRHDLNEGPLPFFEGVFKIVISLNVIEHVICPITFMAELFRVCAPGGHVLISTANSRTLKSLYTLFVRGRFPWTSEEKSGWDSGHLHYFTTRDIVELGENTGFDIAKLEGASIIPDGLKGAAKKALFAILPSGFSREFLMGTMVALFRKPVR